MSERIAIEIVNRCGPFGGGPEHDKLAAEIRRVQRSLDFIARTEAIAEEVGRLRVEQLVIRPRRRTVSRLRALPL